MAKIHKFGFANSLLDSPMATWLTLTGTLFGIYIFPLILFVTPLFTDSTYRPWYVNAATPPKDIVILVDTSAKTQGKLLDVAKDVARLLVQTANPQDQVLERNI